MKFTKPYRTCIPQDITQPFGATNLEAHKAGHTGTDFVSSYGTPIVAPENCFVENIVDAKTLTSSLTELRKGYGVCLQSQETSGVFHLFWHCLPIFPVSIGQYVKRGQIVAFMGNSGLVYSGGVYVPVEERVETKKGTHLHWEVFTTNQKGTRDYFDVAPKIDYTLPVNYDILTAIKIVAQKIFNLIK